jgi:CheY-like chemotaxis protein
VTGFEVVAAHDGIDALSCLYARRPTAVILDLLMPRMDGLELLQQIKGEKAFTDIPIIAVSGEPGALQAAGRAGADHLLQKPLDTDALVAILAGLSRTAENRESGVGQRISPV